MPRAKPKQHRGGRPSKFTPGAALSIVAAISEGKSREAAAEASGVGASTLYRWLQRGRAGEPGFEPFARAVLGAERGAVMGRALTDFVVLGRVRF